MDEQSDTRVLLTKILDLIESHEQSIKDSGVLLNLIGSNLQNRFDSPTFKCGYDPEKHRNPDVVNTPHQAIFHVNQQPENVCAGDAIYFALVSKIKDVLKSPDKTVTASGPASQLVKNLVDKFLSTVDDPMDRTDQEIFEFVRRHESEIQSFIDNDCKDKMISCLIGKIQEIEKSIVIFTSTITSEQGTKVSSSIDLDVEESLPVISSLIPESSPHSAVIAVQPTMSSPQIEKKLPLKIKTNEDDELRRKLQTLNVEVESKFTDLVVDQIGGCQELSQNLTNDLEKSKVFDAVKSNFVEDQLNRQGIMKSVSDLEFENSSSVSKDNPKKQFLRKRYLSKTIMDNIQNTTLDTDEDDDNRSTLARALDEALAGLEKDIRAKLYQKLDSSDKNLTNSLLTNMTGSNIKGVSRR